jgi:hypothetical protein
MTNINTIIPFDLKCRLFAALALRDQRFNWWLREQAEAWLRRVETSQISNNDVSQEMRRASHG